MHPAKLNRPSVEVYLGRGGTGKTRLALYHIGPAPCILFDVLAQDELARNAVICSTATDLVRALQGGARRICWRGFETLGEAAFEFGNRAALHYGGRVLLWDEVDLLMPVAPVPPFAYRIINAGRHAGVTIKATARRPAAISRHLRAAATAVYAYSIIDPRDTAALEQYFTKPEAADLPRLPRGTALIWTEAGTARKKIY